MTHLKVQQLDKHKGDMEADVVCSACDLHVHIYHL